MDIRKKGKSAAYALALVFSLTAVPGHARDGTSLDRSTHQKLEAAQGLMERQEYDQALQDMRRLVAGTDRDYDKAVILQTMGYAYLRKGDYQPGIDAFERALALDVLPKEPRLQAQRALGRMYAATNQHSKAREALEQWLAETEEPSIDDYVTLANVYARLKAYDKGIQVIRKAIRMQQSPRQSHYQLLVAMMFESKRYSEAADVLQDMVKRWPQEKQYWTQLANTYINLDQNLKAHTVMKLAYRKGLLDKQSELLNLVQLGMAAGVPDQSARTLKAEMEKGRIEPNRKHWQMLAQAWSQAKETENAIAAYDQAAKYSKDGEYQLRQAQLYVNENQWHKAASAAQKALSKGGLNSPGQAYLLMGMAHVRQGKYAEGIQAFSQAKRYDDTAGQAASWISYTEQRRKSRSS